MLHILLICCYLATTCVSIGVTVWETRGSKNILRLWRTTIVSYKCLKRLTFVFPFILDLYSDLWNYLWSVYVVPLQWLLNNPWTVTELTLITVTVELPLITHSVCWTTSDHSDCWTTSEQWLNYLWSVTIELLLISDCCWTTSDQWLLNYLWSQWLLNYLWSGRDELPLIRTTSDQRVLNYLWSVAVELSLISVFWTTSDKGFNYLWHRSVSEILLYQLW